MVITADPLFPSRNSRRVNSIKTLNYNRDSLKQKASLSVIARLGRKLATQIFQDCATRCINRSQRLDSDWLKNAIHRFVDFRAAVASAAEPASLTAAQRMNRPLL